MSAKPRIDEQSPDSSSGDFEVVTPSDANELRFVTRAVQIATSGTLAVVNEKGDTVDLPAFPDGHTFPARVRRILATGTTADGIVAYY